jgi:hypothetical protein
MSGTSVNKQLQKAYQRIGSKLGSKFDVYRSVDYLDPVQPKNFLKTVDLSFAFDTTFDKPQTASFNQLNLYVDATDLQAGDIFVNAEGRTITLVNKELMLRNQGVDSTHKITISRPAYGTKTDGTYGTSSLEVARNIPAQTIEITSRPERGMLEHSRIVGGVHQYNFWCWLPEHTLKLNDTIIDLNGVKTLIHSLEYSDIGYKITTMAGKAGS